MGLRGPAPTSRRELAARGSWRAGDRDDELEIEPAKLAPPAGMEAEAKKQWQHIVSILEPKGAITEADRMALTMLCELWSEDRALGKQQKKYVVGSVDWKRMRNARNEVRKQLSAMLAKFGLTPADRPRVKIGNEKPKDNAKSRFFKPRLAG